VQFLSFSVAYWRSGVFFPRNSANSLLFGKPIGGRGFFTKISLSMQMSTLDSPRSGIEAAFVPWSLVRRPYASLIKVGSLQARPKKEIPTGKPRMKPAGTVMLG